MGVVDSYLAEQQKLEERYAEKIEGIESRRNELERLVGSLKQKNLDLTNALTIARGETARAIQRAESKQIEFENIKRRVRAML